MAVESRRVESKPLIARDSFGKSLKKQWRDEHLLLHFSRRHISSPTLVSTVKLDRYNRRIASISLPFGFPPSPAHLSSTNSSESTKYSALGSPGLEEEYEPGMPGMNAKWGSWKEPRGKRWEPSRMILLPIGFTILLATIFLTRSASSTDLTEHVRNAATWLGGAEEPLEPFDATLVLNHAEPQDSLHSQLKPDVRYITSLSYGGHANQFIGIQNLLYLAKILNRVAIVPTLTPLHFKGLPQDMSKFYDIQRFYQETSIPLVELSKFKWWNFEKPPPVEPLTCWSVLENVADGRNVNDGSMAVHNIDVKYYPLPPLTRADDRGKLWFESIHDFDSDWWSKQQWIDKVRKERLPHVKISDDAANDTEPETKPGFDVTHNEPPTDQTFCLDTTFFFGSRMFPPAFPPSRPVEALREYEGHGWIEAGQHLRFSNHLEGLADLYLTRLFDVSKVKNIPPFITVHIRRGDFATERGLTSLDKYTDAVQRVREKLNWRIDNPDGWEGPGKGMERYRKGYRGEDYAVVVATDEAPTSDFVKTLKNDLGWKVIDHDFMQTEKEMGEWYPLLIDSAILARGGGFVGTEWSTFSYLAALRVKYWNGGVQDWTPSP